MKIAQLRARAQNGVGCSRLGDTNEKNASSCKRADERFREVAARRLPRSPAHHGTAVTRTPDPRGTPRQKSRKAKKNG